MPPIVTVAERAFAVPFGATTTFTDLEPLSGRSYYYVRAILKDTVRVKRDYARRLRFGLGDYIRMGMESAAGVLPPAVIMGLFYALNGGGYGRRLRGREPHED
jgi:hypothetical protein